MKQGLVVVVIAALAAACGLVAMDPVRMHASLVDGFRLPHLSGSNVDAMALAVAVEESVAVPPEPFALRRRDVHVGARWGREGVWLAAAVRLFASRIDVDALPYGTPVSVWTLGEDVIAAEVQRMKEAGGPLFAALAFMDAKRPKNAQFYDEQGRAIEGAFTARPVAYRSVASRYGMRIHPITGRSQKHRGIDLSARTGTPVHSTGDGVVMTATENASAGLHVVVRHAGGVRTKYFHLDAIGEGVKPGVRVKRGDVLGLVGSTGLSTGPHLHYEIVKWGVHVDPIAFEWPGGARLSKKQRDAHKQVVARLRAMTSDEVMLTWVEAPVPDGPDADARPATTALRS